MFESPDHSSTPAEFEELDSICDRFEAAWKRGDAPRLEDFLASRQTSNSRELFRALLELELDYRQRLGEVPAPVDYLLRFSEFADVVREMDSSFVAANAPERAPTLKRQRTDGELARGALVGRYEIQRKLDAGAFATVYVGRDTALGRRVAIKVAHVRRQPQPQDLLMLEPKTAARFEHPHIVPVYDVGRLPDRRLFIVSQFIDGTTLKEKLDYFRIRPHQAAELISRIAIALHYAHQKAVIHRDVKPANILLDGDLWPYLTDFGLALPAGARRGSPDVTGTPAYMSPEQARGEIHLVDERSDVFSLCAVFYELLTGSRPFPGHDTFEVLEQVREATVIPPREVDDRVPRELQRIILKGLQKQALLRYQSAEELADDLNTWLDEGDGQPSIRPSARDALTKPPGLAPFDESASAFFRRLIPGPRAKHDLPESIEFWRQRIESRGEAESLRIGVLYGPSGSGKSSFFRAGLQPYLRDVVCCFVQATPTHTPQLLLAALHERFPGLKHESDLVEVMRQIRGGGWLDGHQKLLIVLDQFEQWLSTQSDFTDSDLVAALRQCNGTHTQALLLIRDDFWGPLTRCVQALDLELDRNNHRLVDSFDVEHAKTVLLELGKGYGCLPQSGSRQDAFEFAEAVVYEMTATGPLIPIRLSLFAHAFRGRPWTTDRLRQAAGVRGVIGSFVDDLLRGDRLLSRNQMATVRVLQALLPPAGKLIKERPRTRDEIAEASGVPPGTCGQILQALEHHSPLVTTVESEPNVQHVQLAHDHLVPIVEDWTGRRLGSTRRGRAESLLRERTEAWRARQDSRSLPSMSEWLAIITWGRGAPWNSAARWMMERATRRHLTVLIGLALAALTIIGLAQRSSRLRTAAHLVQRLEDATTSEIPSLLAEGKALARLVNSRVEKRIAIIESSSHAKAADCRRLLHLHMALISDEPEKHVPRVAAFAGVLPDVSIQHLPRPAALPAVYALLAPHVPLIAEDLQRVAASAEIAHDLRLRAASALTSAPAASNHWPDARTAERIVRSLISAPPIELSAWIGLMAPIKQRLLPSLAATLHEHSDLGTETASATLYAAYANSQQLVYAIDHATPLQIPILVGSLREHDAMAILLAHFKSITEPITTVDLVQPDVDAANSLLQNYEGAASSRGAFAQNIPWKEHESVFAQMAVCGYWVNSLRPYSIGDQLRFAITCEPGARTIQTRLRLSPANFVKVHQQLQQQGYELMDLTGYEQNDQQLFAALWTLDNRGTIPTEAYLDQDWETHKSLFSQLPEKHFRPVRLFTRTTPEGKKRTSAIWKLVDADQRDYVVPHAGFSAGDSYPGYLMRDCQIFLPRHPLRATDGYLATQIRNLKGPAYDEFRELIDRGEFRKLREHPQLSSALRDAEVDIVYSHAWTDTIDRTSELLISRQTADHYRRAADCLEAGLIPASIAMRNLEAEETVAVASVWHRPLAPEVVVQEIASQRANGAIALAQLRNNEPLRRTLAEEFGRQAASYAVHRLAATGATAGQVLSLRAERDSDTFVYNLLLALADCDAGTRSDAADYLANIASDNPAIISARDYCARKLSLPATGRKSVHVNSIGSRMIPVKAPRDGRVLIGSPCWERHHDPKEAQCYREVQRDFALSATEVTQQQFALFLANEKVRRYYDRIGRQPTIDMRYLTSDDCPRIDVTYFDAVLFCQWLSERENIPPAQQCYPAIWNADEGRYRMPEDAFARSGYRLPTEPEWDLACRAGSTSSRHYGSADDLIASYAWGAMNSENHVHPVARLRPNEFGFFDMLGNAAEWCHDPYLRFCDNLDSSHLSLSKQPERTVRGGRFQSLGATLRSATRLPLAPSSRNFQIGFRIARNLRDND